MSFAIIETGSKQYKVKVGDKIKIEKISDEYNEGDSIVFEKVLAFSNDGKEIELGKPALENKKVEAVLLKKEKGKKIRIQKFKSKSNYDKVLGHRQNYFLVEIKSI